MITALTQLGGGHATASPPTVVQTLVAGGSPADRELLGDIPASIRPSCGKAVDPEPGNAAAFNCSYRDVVQLQYNLFASTSELRRAFAVVKLRYGLTHARAQVLRFVDKGSASIVWADEARDVLGFAWRHDADQQALYDAWLVIDRSR